MLWKEVKTWATSHGYKVDRTKVEDQENSYNYVWETESCSGVANSTFDLAKDIYNHITSDQYLEYQTIYKTNQSFDDIHKQQAL
jgi:hypothetical protein